jgi:hypothetical protein
MSRRWLPLALVLFTMPGCRPDPIESRLELGATAILYNEKSSRVGLDQPPGEEFPHDSPAWISPSVPVGTRVEVIDDQAAGEGWRRKTRVKILEGENAGLVALVNRSNLRPESSP